jgi:class 3 adenylate cyclase/integral membrane sensor domain MASE1
MIIPGKNNIWRNYPVMSYTLANVLMVGCYLFGAKVGFFLAFLNSQVSPIWPPEGFALAGLFIGGYRLVPGIFIGALLANYLLNPHLPSATLIALGNTGSNVIGYFLFTIFSKDRYPFISFRSTLYFLFLTVPGSAFSALIGVSSLLYFEFIPSTVYWNLFLTWSFGEQQGFLVVSSSLLALHQAKKEIKNDFLTAYISKSLLFIAITLIVIYISQFFLSEDSPLLFLPIPVLIFTTLFFKEIGTAASILGIAFTAVYFTIKGQGPFFSEEQSLNTTLMYLDGFIFSISTMCFLLLSILRERESAQKSSLDNLSKRLKETQRIAELSSAFRKYVPEEFLEILGRHSISDIQLGDQVQRSMTILFVDIRNFTDLSESMTPKENFNFINGYLKRMSPHIHKNGGFVDKYIGDAIMALFPKAEDAVTAALGMQSSLNEFNKERHEKRRPSLKVGIGIHSGTLMLGTIGESSHMETTVISDAVNLASRMEGLTKIYGANILVSETTLSQITDPLQFDFRLLDKVRVKGKKGAVSVIEIIDHRDLANAPRVKATREKFEKGVFHYLKQEFLEAKAYFEDILSDHPEDKPAKIYVERCEYMSQHGVPPGWDGIEAFKVK